MRFAEIRSYRSADGSLAVCRTVGSDHRAPDNGLSPVAAAGWRLAGSPICGRLRCADTEQPHRAAPRWPIASHRRASPHERKVLTRSCPPTEVTYTADPAIPDMRDRQAEITGVTWKTVPLFEAPPVEVVPYRTVPPGAARRLAMGPTPSLFTPVKMCRSVRVHCGAVAEGVN